MRQSLFTVTFFLISIISYCQADNLKVLIPNAESESEYIWQNIRDIKFFEANNYALALPHHVLIDSLLANSRNESLCTADYDSLRTLMQRSVYDSTDYTKGYQKIVEMIPTIEKVIAILSETQINWNFALFPQYQIALTLYGPGGSYDLEIGRILLQTTADGSFKGYNNPANTIIHEMIHIGIDSSIVQKYNLTHTQKERIVDRIVQILFFDLLPEYILQGFGDSRIDKYLASKEDFINLPQRIERFLAENGT